MITELNRRVWVLLLVTSAPAASQSANQTLISQLRAAPLEFVQDSTNITLSADANRDFMPSIEPNDRSLRVFFSAVAAGSGELPADLIPEQVWVIRDTTVWNISVPAATIHRTRGKLAAMVWGGPQWAPGDSVDVVVRYRTKSGIRLVRSARRAISQSS
jgi:hypothetical protein